MPKDWNVWNGVGIPLNSDITKMDFEDVRVLNCESRWQWLLWYRIQQLYHKYKYYARYSRSYKSILTGRYYTHILNLYYEMFIATKNLLNIYRPHHFQSKMAHAPGGFTDRMLYLARYFEAEKVIFPKRLMGQIQQVKFKWEKIEVEFYTDVKIDVLEYIFKYGTDVWRYINDQN